MIKEHRKKRPGKTPGVEAAIQLRRMELRGGRSVREVSRSQHELDNRDGSWTTIRNRMSWAKNPLQDPDRMIKKVIKKEIVEDIDLGAVT